MASNSSSKKAFVVSLDTSDTINLNFLDVILPRFHVDLNKNKFDVNLDRRTGALRNPTKEITDSKSVYKCSSISSTENNLSINPNRYQESKPKIMISSNGFDRRGRMTRIIADCVEESDDSCSNCHKHPRICRNIEKLRRKKTVNLTEILGSDDAPHSFSFRDEQLLQKNTYQDQACGPIDADCSVTSNEIPETCIEEKPSAAEIRLAEALKQLKETCKDADANKCTDITAVPSTQIPSLVNSVRQVSPDSVVADSSSCSPKPLKKTQTLAQSCSDSFQSEAHHQNYWRVVTPRYSTPSPSHTADSLAHSSPPVMLSHQKTAAIWDWVSSKYAYELPPGSLQESSPPLSPARVCNDTRLRLLQSEGEVAPECLLPRTVGRTMSERMYIGGFKPWKVVEPLSIHFAYRDNPISRPMPIIMKPSPLMGPRTPLLPSVTSAGSNYIQITPPATSTVWSSSPLYQVGQHPKISSLDQDRTTRSTYPTTELKSDAISSNCSLTPAVHSSIASLSDIHSRDDIATCSTASTFTELDYRDRRLSGDKNSPPDAHPTHEHHILEVLSQIGKAEVVPASSKHKAPLEREKSEEPQAHSSAAHSKNPTVPVKDLEVNQKRTLWEASVVEIAPAKPRRSISPCSIIASDLQFIKSNDSNPSPGEKLVGESTTSDIIHRKTSASESSIFSISQLRTCRKRKDKKGKRSTKIEKSGNDNSVTDGEVQRRKQWAKRLKNRITQTTHSKILLHPTTSESKRLRKLKSALPRTPGGSYAFRNKAAEAAIAEYVKAELAASLQLKPNPEKDKSKPGNFRGFLKKVTSPGNIGCKESGASSPLRSQRQVPPSIQTSSRNMALSKKNSVSKKLPLRTTEVSPRRCPHLMVIPNLSTRINFIRYQQQSVAALLGKSRAAMRASGCKEALVASKVPPKISSHLCLHPMDAPESVQRRRNGPTSNGLKSNRNVVSVVFGDCHQE